MWKVCLCSACWRHAQYNSTSHQFAGGGMETPWRGGEGKESLGKEVHWKGRALPCFLKRENHLKEPHSRQNWICKDWTMDGDSKKMKKEESTPLGEKTQQSI